MQEKTCPTCNAIVDQDDKICRICGKEIPVARYCAGCGNAVNPVDTFCPTCGKAFRSTSYRQAAPQLPQQSLSADSPIQNVIICRNCWMIVDAHSQTCPSCETEFSKNYQRTYDQEQYSSGGQDGVKQAAVLEDLSLFGYWLKCMKNYVVFRGRARRKEYWGFVLFNIVFSVAIGFLSKFVLTAVGVATGIEDQAFVEKWSIHLQWIWNIAVFLPAMSVFVRRMHDIGKSGWTWILVPICIFLSSSAQTNFPTEGMSGNIALGCALAITGFAAAVVIIIFACKNSDSGDNEYGPNPKGQ